MLLASDSEVAGRYRVVRAIGRGGMGVVYEVEHRHTGQHLALKVLVQPEGTHADTSTEAVERFKREARASGRIKSENVVRITDADVAPELDGAPFFVMELLEGSDLGSLTDEKPASRAEVVEWLRQAARGLSRAHELGIIHRDLKPENLFLTRRDDGAPLVKILDFGIAKTLADASVQTRSGQIIGTPMYMAPEQALAGTAPITIKTDLYALGLIAFRLLTSQYFWRDGSLAQLVAQILYNPIEPPTKRFPALGPEFDGWFLRACAREPEARFESAPQQVEALAKALGVASQESGADRSGPTRVVVPIEANAIAMAKTFDVSTPQPSAPARTLDSSASAISAPTPAPRRTGWLALIAVGTAALLGGGFFLLRNDSRRDRGSAAQAAASPSASAPAASTTVSTTALAPIVPPTPVATAPSTSTALAPTAVGKAPASTPVSAKASASAPTAVPSVVASAAPSASAPTPKPSASLDPLADQK